MDPTRFDNLARSLVRPASRRRLGILLGGAAALLAGASTGEAKHGHDQTAPADACKANGKSCKKNSQCCSSNCVGGTGRGSTAHSDGVCQPPRYVQSSSRRAYRLRERQ